MTITQTINTLTNPINRDTQTPAEISEAGDTTIAELQTIFGQQNTLSGQINSSIIEMNADVSSSASNAASALSSKTSAESAKDQALASSNFKGNWSDLTGSLSVPASVLYNNQYWMLTSDIADVTAKTPGVDSEWSMLSYSNLVDRQTAIDMLAGQGPGYWFDGVDDIISIADNANIDFGTGDFSIIFIGSLSDTITGSIVDKGGNGAQRYKIGYSDTNVFFQVRDDTTKSASFSTTDHLNKNSVITGVRSGDDLFLFLDSKQVATATGAAALNPDNTYPLGIGAGYRSSIENPSICISNAVMVFNLVLSDAERIAIENGAPIPYKYLGASQTEQTSGTLTIGKAYLIKDFIAGDDFTNIGGINEDGNEFVATGTTPTTWTNSSVLVQIGCVLNLNPSGIGHNTWQDVSGNQLHGAVSGALPVNIPADHSEKYIDLTVTGDTSFTLPAGYIIDSIVLDSDGAIGGGIDIGTTNGGGEIVTAEAVAGAGKVLCTLVAGANYNLTGADDIIYITDADGTGWDSATVAFTVKMSRMEV